MGQGEAKLSKDNAVWLPEVADPSPICGILPGPAGYWLTFQGQELNDKDLCSILLDAHKKDIGSNVTKLDLSGQTNITKLPKILREFTALRLIDLRRSGILPTSLDALRDVGLEELDISDCGIASLDNPLTRVKSLRLGASPIVDLSQFATMPQLTKLFLYEMPSSVTTLAGFPTLARLRILDLDNCGLTSFKGLPPLESLEHLLARSNKLETIKDLPPLPALTHLLIPSNRLETLQGVDHGLPQLRVLNASSNRLRDVSAVATLPSLRRLLVSGNTTLNCADLAVLASVTTLEQLVCHGMHLCGKEMAEHFLDTVTVTVDESARQESGAGMSGEHVKTSVGVDGASGCAHSAEKV